MKYASNAFLAVKISYINEIARLCESLGANVKDVAKGMGLDSRIGSEFLQASSGWSGSCFPKDTRELLATSLKYDRELLLVRAAMESNIAMHRFCLEKMRHKLHSLNGKTVGILGLTFKPNTDDARQTQASYFIQELNSFGATIRVHDPKGMTVFQSCHPDLPVVFCKTAEEAGHRADCLLLLTHWNEYKDLDWKEMYDKMKNPYILDTRNFLPKERLVEIGFQYEGIGLL
jgi:UDPglucose 6-dehydrogenase